MYPICCCCYCCKSLTVYCSVDCEFSLFVSLHLVINSYRFIIACTQIGSNKKVHTTTIHTSIHRSNNKSKKLDTIEHLETANKNIYFYSTLHEEKKKQPRKSVGIELERKKARARAHTRTHRQPYNGCNFDFAN